MTGNGWKICQFAPPMPPAAPSPPSPPPPVPRPPGEICEDTCSTKNNGVCEDPYGDPEQPKLMDPWIDEDAPEIGYIGSCKTGTDCTDCERAHTHACALIVLRLRNLPPSPTTPFALALPLLVCTQARLEASARRARTSAGRVASSSATSTTVSTHTRTRTHAHTRAHAHTYV